MRHLPNVVFQILKTNRAYMKIIQKDMNSDAVRWNIDLLYFVWQVRLF